MEGFESYFKERIAPAPHERRKNGLALYLGLAVLLAAASLLAVNDRGAPVSRVRRRKVAGTGGPCTPPNGVTFTGSDSGVSMTVCISKEGIINQIQYPDTALGHTQIAFDGYCLSGEGVKYKDYSSGSGVTSTGFGPATLTGPTGPNNEIYSMTRATSDGRFRLTEFIKVNVQPRSVFVGMTVKNLDSVSHNSVYVYREIAPAIDGSAADDQYNEFGRTASGVGTTGQAFQGPTVGTNSLLFGATSSSALVFTGTVSNFQAGGGCANYPNDPPGYVTGGNRVFWGLGQSAISLNAGASATIGKFVYRML